MKSNFELLAKAIIMVAISDCKNLTKNKIVKTDYCNSDELTNLEKNSSGALLANEKNFSKGTLYEIKYTLDANNNYIFNYSQPTS